MTSYQRLKQKIAYLEQCESELIAQRDFYLKAILKAKKDAEECWGVGSDLVRVVKGLPVWYPQPGINGDDFLTPYNSEEIDATSLVDLLHRQELAKLNFSWER